MLQTSRSIAFFVLGLLACSPSDNEPSLANEVDSLSVPIARLSNLDESQAPLWATELIHSTEGRDSLEVGDGFEITATFVGDSSLWIAGRTSILVIGNDGARIGTVGRHGDGPGELSLLTAIGLGGTETIFASEIIKQRITWFRFNGDVSEVTSGISSPRAGLDMEIITTRDSGQFIAVPWQSRPAIDMSHSILAGAYHRDRITVFRYNGDGTVLDSLGEWPGVERVRGMPTRFARATIQDGRGRAMVIGTSDSIDLTVFDDLKRIRRVLGPPLARPVSDAAVTAWRNGVNTAMNEYGPAVIKIIEEALVHSTLPTLGGVVIDDEGNLWIGEYATPADRERRWHVISSLGVPLGQLMLPALTTAYFPSRTELLDVAMGRVALLRETSDGELVVEVRMVRR